ncbi:uncharacterized protein LOC134469444 [Engraulis encrasicolus]|uniref:uncharacterized protein LOC134469444 n=1 Tax=Engraulis encrasicolus TaxID=184585 RepID=UPI002FD6E0F4
MKTARQLLSWYTMTWFQNVLTLTGVPLPPLWVHCDRSDPPGYCMAWCRAHLHCQQSHCYQALHYSQQSEGDDRKRVGRETGKGRQRTLVGNRNPGHPHGGDQALCAVTCLAPCRWRTPSSRSTALPMSSGGATWRRSCRCHHSPLKLHCRPLRRRRQALPPKRRALTSTALWAWTGGSGLHPETLGKDANSAQEHQQLWACSSCSRISRR